jgi:hypothetical protein
VRKARWSSAYHGLWLALAWTDPECFEVVDRPIVTEETIRNGLLAAIRENPGISWTRLRDRKKDGVVVVTGGAEDKMAMRGRLLAEGVIVNSRAPRATFGLTWPTIPP